MSVSLLSVHDLTVSFSTKRGIARAVNGIDFTLAKGEKLGLVGESGSGKSVTAKSIMRLLQSPPATIGGRIELDGENLLAKSEAEMCKYRGNKISMIFQEPMVSLNPLFSIGNQLAEALRQHTKLDKKSIEERVLKMLRVVGIPSPETRLRQYPFEMSGGMRQRIMIAMALLCQPQIIIADEPTTALDVTIQAQIMELLNEVNREFGTAIILITHDLGVIAEMVDSVAVMYAGSIVEKARVGDVFERPLHPYTEGLLRSVPTMEDKGEVLDTIEGQVPSLYDLPEGCAFHNRCHKKKKICLERNPPVCDRDGRQVKCWIYSQNWDREAADAE